MTHITETALASLDAEGRLLSPVFKGATTRAGRFAFRGEIALKYSATMADEKRPPEIKLDQVMTVANAGAATLPFLAGMAVSLAHLTLLCEVLGDKLGPDGKYFFFASNLDITKRYQIPYAGVTFHVLPLDESTVYNELTDLFHLDRTSLKKFDTGGKLLAIADGAAKFQLSFEEISFEQGLQVMGPIKIKENRPV
jgi:hypothetical protein